MSGGGIFNNGGGVTIDGSVNSVSVSNNTIDAAGAGGGIYANGGSVSANDAAIDANQDQGIFAENGATVALSNVSANDAGNGLETDGAGAVTIDTGTFSGIFARDTASVATDGTVSSSAPIDWQTTGDIAVNSGGLAGTASVTLAPGAMARFSVGTTSTYSGTTSLTSGTTQMDGDLATGGDVTVGSAAVLGGSGNIARNVVVDGTLNPGAAPSASGILSVQGNVSFGAGAIFHVDLGGTTAGSQFDQLIVTDPGSVSIDSAASLAGTVTTTFVPGAILNVLNNQSSGAIAGAFANASLPATHVILGDIGFHYSYAGGDGNDFVLAPQPSVDLSVTASDDVISAIPGQSVTYTIVAANFGGFDAAGSTVTDHFPAQCISVNWTCSGTPCGPPGSDSGSGDISDTVNLPIGAIATYTAQCSIDSGATTNLFNVAMITPASGVVETNPTDNTAVDTDTLAIAADVAVSMTDNRDFARVGDSIDYVIDVTNPSGPSTAVASISDILPAELDSGSWTCTPSGSATCGSAGGTGNTLTDTATIPVGDGVSYLYSATVLADNALDVFTNRVTASLNNGTDSTPGNNESKDSDFVVIFRDGFEGDSVSVIQPVGSGADHVVTNLQVNANLLRGLGIAPVTVASGLGADGEILFRLQFARFGGDYEMRVLTRDDLGLSERSSWYRLDERRGLLTVDWQSASDKAADGYLRVAASLTGLIMHGRSERDRLANLQIRADHDVPWLVQLPD